jgi:hypothetical protein
VLAIAVALAVGAPVTASGPADGARTRCKDVLIRTGDGSVYTRTHRLLARNTTCRTARRVARTYLRENEGADQVAPLGYHCAGSAQGVACHKGIRRVSWRW